MPLPNPGTPPTIDALPEAPVRNTDGPTFNSKAAQFVAALDPFGDDVDAVGTWMKSAADFVEEQTASAALSAGTAVSSAATSVAAASSAINSPGTNATSTSSITPVVGSNAFTLAQTGKAFVVGQFVTVADSTTPTTKFFNGAITAFNSGMGAITVNATAITGGSGSSWVITASAPAQGEQFNSPVQSFVALGNVTGTTNIDLRTALVFTMTLTGNTTLTFTMPTLYTSSTSVAVSLKITKSGSQTLTLPAGTTWHDGVAPTLTVGGTDELLFTKDGSADWVGSRARKAIA